MSGVGEKPRSFETKSSSAKVFSHGGGQAVTANVNEFDRVASLKVVNWRDPPR